MADPHRGERRGHQADDDQSPDRADQVDQRLGEIEQPFAQVPDQHGTREQREAEGRGAYEPPHSGPP